MPQIFLPYSLFRIIQQPPRIGLWGLQAARIEGQILRGSKQPQLQIWLLVSSGSQQCLELLQGSGLSGFLQLPTGICLGLMNFYTEVCIAVGCFQQTAWSARAGILYVLLKSFTCSQMLRRIRVLCS